MRFPATTVDGETVYIVRKEQIANVGLFLYSDDGRKFKRKDGGQELVELAEPAEETVDDDDFGVGFNVEPEDGYAGTDEADHGDRADGFA